MLWLFGEIWLWLLVAFVLGLSMAAFAFLSARRYRRATADEERTDTTPRVTIPDTVPDTERTQRIRRVGPQLHFGDRTPDQGTPLESSARSRPGYDLDEVPDEGRRAGVLPLTPSEWHARNEWPDERDIAGAEKDAEENRPRRER
ncbi:hypothetical protein AB8O38_11500 [Saccharomonospora xinjiangensis]|uniref:hypothetical protein n=1 Tax=Saccharomonospora xinjiangensis TaxID=75294 RepID=UPI00350FDAAA